MQGEVYALDLETGRRVWVSRLGGIVHDGSPVYHDGQVISNTFYGGVEAHDAATGKKLWSYKTGDGFMFSWPAAAGDAVYQTSFDGTLTAITLPE